MARKDFKMKSGLIPDEIHLLRTITTAEVEAFLQSKIDVAVASIVAKGEKMSPVTLKCYSTTAGTKMIPFAILLPVSVLAGEKDTKDTSDDDGVLDIFKTEETRTKGCKLREEFKKALCPYSYDKDDGYAFKSDIWRREFGVSRDGSYQLQKMREPKIVSTDHGRYKNVTFILDPMRIFHDMMRCDLAFGNEQYIMDICSWKTIKKGLYSYVVEAKTYRGNSNKGKNKNKRDDYIFSLDRKMRGSR